MSPEPVSDRYQVIWWRWAVRRCMKRTGELLPQMAQMQGPYANIYEDINRLGDETEWVCAHQRNCATVIIPPQLRAAKPSRQEAQTHGDGGGNDADGGNHDDHRLTAIQTIEIGWRHGEAVAMVDECWIRVSPWWREVDWIGDLSNQMASGFSVPFQASKVGTLARAPKVPPQFGSHFPWRGDNGQEGMEGQWWSETGRMQDGIDARCLSSCKHCTWVRSTWVST